MKKLIPLLFSAALLISGCSFSSGNIPSNDTVPSTGEILTTKNTEAEDDSIENSEMYDALVMRFMDANPNTLNQKQLTVAALITFDAEMMNGGLCQFLINDYQGYAQYVGDALTEVGAPEMQKHYTSFLSQNEIDVTKMDFFCIASIEDYLKQLKRFPYEEFDKTFSEIYEQENLWNLLIAYVQRYEEEILGR